MPIDENDVVPETAMPETSAAATQSAAAKDLKEEERLIRDKLKSLAKDSGIKGSTSCSHDQFRRLFPYFDKDGDGKIAFVEFITAIGVKRKDDVAAKVVFMDYDTSGDGHIGEQEFIHMMCYA